MKLFILENNYIPRHDLCYSNINLQKGVIDMNKKTGFVFILLAFIFSALVTCSNTDAVSTGKAAEADNSLSALLLSKGTLNPSFDPYISGYSCELTDDTSMINIIAKTADSDARLYINGVLSKSGMPSTPIMLTQNDNIILIEVLAANELPKTYSVDIIKKASVSTVSAVTFSHVNGTVFSDPIDVTLSCATSGAVIYYTTDGSTPGTSSSVYSQPVHVTDTVTIKAIAVKSGMTNSPVTSTLLTKSSLIQVSAVQYTPGNGTTFTDSVSVTLSSSTSGATIRYTID
jgi:hypothetical protein